MIASLAPANFSSAEASAKAAVAPSPAHRAAPARTSLTWDIILSPLAPGGQPAVPGVPCGPAYLAWVISETSLVLTSYSIITFSPTLISSNLMPAA